MAAGGHKVSFLRDEDVLHLCHDDGGTTLNILKATEFYTLKRLILWHVNYI